MGIDNYQIFPLQSTDVPAVLSIEREGYPHPWSAEQFLQELDNPVSTVDLLWKNKQLAGYICYWLIAGEMQILNVATAADQRRKGVAGLLLESVLNKCAVERAWLEVRAGNRAAIALYRRYGFVADVVRRGYYRDGENAQIMLRDFVSAS